MAISLLIRIMRCRTAVGVCLLLAAVAPRTAWAWEFEFFDQEDASLEVTNTFAYTYFFDNDPEEYDLSDPAQKDLQLGKLHDDKFHQIFNKLDVSLSYGEIRVGARLDLYLFADTPASQHCDGVRPPNWCNFDPDNRYQDQFVAERLYVMVTRPAFDLTLGDFYGSFGKGIALHVIQLDEVGQDTTIRGGKLAIHEGAVGFTFLAGTFNILDLDLATGYDAPWHAEPVIGARLEYNVLETVIVGAHTAWVLRDDHDPDNPSEVLYDAIWGVGFEVPDLWDGLLELNGEINFRQTVEAGELIRGPGREGEGLDGVAAYASATLQIQDLTALAEFKYYNEFELISFDERPYSHVYHLPPTLDRKKAQIKEGNSDVSGFRLLLDYALGELGPVELMLFANYGYFESWEDDTDVSIHSAYGGLEMTWADSTGQLNATAGMRRLHDNLEDTLFHEDVHFEISVEQALGHHSLELRYLLLDRATKKLLGLDEWKEMELTLTYAWSPYVTVALIYERQEDPALVPKEREDPNDLSSALVPVPQNLFGAQIRGYINGGTYINLRIGESRAGIKCLNGICRQMPAFAGMEATFVVRY